MIIPDPERLKRGRAAVIECARSDCDICLKACSLSAIRIVNGRPYSDPEKCVGCGGCAVQCPERAIILLKDRCDGTAELSFASGEQLPEIDDEMEIMLPEGTTPARVIQAIPVRLKTRNSLIRAVVDINALLKGVSQK
ncbi:MAG: 4Fe-4S binding protein [Clostridia bacterium]|nr:4Fe-4S binding protein [Clostridia bacterium]